MSIGIRKKTGLIFIFFLLLVHSVAPAQETPGLFLLSDIPQSSLENPAVQNSTGRLAVGIPLLSGLSFDWNASVPFNSLFSEGFSYSFYRFYDTLDEQGKGWASAGALMFFASLQHNDYTFSLSVAERGFSAAEFDREIVRFIRDGNMPFYGVDENLGPASFFVRHYRELAPGISKRVGDWLDIGIRPKILFTKLSFQTEDLHFSVKTLEERNRLLLKPEGSFQLTGPYVHQRNAIYNYSRFSAHVSPGDYFFQPRNLGMALDLGVILRTGDFSEWSLSLIDAGMIGSKHNSYDVTFDRPIIYSKFTTYQSHTPADARYREPREALKAFGDSVSYIIDVADAKKRVYTLLPLKINASFKRKISKKTSVGVKNQLLLYQSHPRNRFTPYIKTGISPGFDVYGSLTIQNFAAIMPGFGFSYTGEKVQFYFAGNNIPGIVQPASAKHLNLCFGVNLLFDTK